MITRFIRRSLSAQATCSISTTEPQTSQTLIRNFRKWSVDEEARLLNAVQKIESTLRYTNPPRRRVNCIGSGDPRLERRIRRPNDTWQLVSDIVGSRSATQCLTKFHYINCIRYQSEDSVLNAGGSLTSPNLAARTADATRNYRPWTEQEDMSLIKYTHEVMASKPKSRTSCWDTWRRVSLQIPGRNAHSCLYRYKRLTCNGSRVGRWSFTETAMLVDGYRIFPGNWKAIAEHVGTRNVHQCYKHYFDRVTIPMKGSWSDEEAERLLVLISTFGKNWSTVGRIIGRSASSCKIKYDAMHSPTPRKSKGKTLKPTWTADEERRLLEVVSEDYIGPEKNRSAAFWQQVAEQMHAFPEGKPRSSEAYRLRFALIISRKPLS